MARVTGLEPATSGVTGRHSNRLSYTRASTPHAQKTCGGVARWIKWFDPECQALAGGQTAAWHILGRSRFHGCSGIAWDGHAAPDSCCGPGSNRLNVQPRSGD